MTGFFDSLTGAAQPPLFSVCFPFQNMLQWRKTAREGTSVADLNTDIRFIKGVGENKLDPTGNSTRGQVATVIVRYATLVQH